MSRSTQANIAGIILLVFIVALAIASYFNPALLFGSRPQETEIATIQETIEPEPVTENEAIPVEETATTLSAQEQAETVLGEVEMADLNSVLVNDLNGRIVIDFNMRDNNLSVAHTQMAQMLCAIQENGPSGYTLRFGGRMSNGMGGISATISSTAIQNADCSNPGAIDIESIADEYDAADGL